jgi:hypothetical protein
MGTVPYVWMVNHPHNVAQCQNLFCRDSTCMGQFVLQDDILSVVSVIAVS